MDDKRNEKDKGGGEGTVAVAAPPEPPKPYPAPGYPKAVFNKAGNAPPRIVNNDEELAALNPKEWTQIPPVESKDKPSSWPKIYCNVNIPCRQVNSEAEADLLGPDWREFVPTTPPAAPKK